MIPTQVVQITDPRFQHLSGLELFTSLEGENPGGSVKDRMVAAELSEKLARRELLPGSTISEVSAGSTALSLACWSQPYRLHCHLFVPQNLAPEKVMTLQSRGAVLHLSDPTRAYEDHEEFQKSQKSWFFNQFHDLTKERHYQRWGELLTRLYGPFDAVMGCVGTGHSLRGLSKGLRTPSTWTVEPADFRTPGLRNFDKEQYGDQDPCRNWHFDKRIFVKSSDLLSDTRVMTDNGMIQVSTSFCLVLSALFQIETGSSRKIWLLGADNRRC